MSGYGRIAVAYAAAGAVLSALVMARGIWHSNPAWRGPFVFVGWWGLAVSGLVMLNVLSVGGAG